MSLSWGAATHRSSLPLLVQHGTRGIFRREKSWGLGLSAGRYFKDCVCLYCRRRHPGTHKASSAAISKEAHKHGDLALLQTPCHYWVWGEGWEVLRHICDVNDMRLLSICACGMRVLINHKKRAKNWPLAMQRPSTELETVTHTETGLGTACRPAHPCCCCCTQHHQHNVSYPPHQSVTSPHINLKHCQSECQ